MGESNEISREIEITEELLTTKPGMSILGRLGTVTPVLQTITCIPCQRPLMFPGTFLHDISAARVVYCFLAVAKLHYPGVEVGRRLGICGPSVSRAVRRGEEQFQSRVDLWEWWDGV